MLDRALAVNPDVTQTVLDRSIVARSGESL